MIPVNTNQSQCWYKSEDLSAQKLTDNDELYCDIQSHFNIEMRVRDLFADYCIEHNIETDNMTLFEMYNICLDNLNNIDN
jgi:hypothetical protein